MDTLKTIFIILLLIASPFVVAAFINSYPVESTYVAIGIITILFFGYCCKVVDELLN